MTVSTAALQYLATLPMWASFWQWAPERDAVEWIDGSTIAFRQELRAVLEPFAGRGLPPLDLVVLALAACRETWPEDSKQLADLEKALTLRVSKIIGQWYQDAVRHLGDMNRLPVSLRTSLAGKGAIIETALEKHTVRTTPEEGRAVLDLLESSGWMRESGISHPRIKGVGQWSIELRGLCDGLRRIDEESLHRRMQTGLDTVPLPAAPEKVEPDAPLPPPPTVTQLIRELREDDEFAGLMRLTRSLSAVVSLPRPVAEPDEMAMGGVSDIANRGALDRLLLSELAHDDDTLVTRIALSEALYLRRETPPATPPRERVILLDSGLRMWGTPRVYAAAVGLALASLGEREGTTRVLRAAGESLAEVDFTTRAGLERHLAALERRLDLSEAILSLARTVDPLVAETILITSEAGAANESVRRQLRELLPVCYVATVSQTGDFSLWSRTLAGTKTVRRARLDLSALLEPPRHRPAVPLVDHDRGELPGALRLEAFPLRLPCDIPSWRNFLNVEVTGSHPQRSVILTNDRRLTLWSDRATGGRQITDRVPKGDVQWFRFDDRGGLLDLVLGQLAQGELHGLRIDLDQARVVSSVRFAVPQEAVHCVTEHHGLFSIRRNAVDQIDIQTGRVLQTATPTAGMTWSRGRFFKGMDGWFALSGGARPQWELLLPRKTVGPDFVLTIVDVPEMGLPAAILSSGEILLLDPDLKNPPAARSLSHIVGPNARIEVVFHSGRCVLLTPRGPNGQARHLIDLGRPESMITPLSKNTRQLFDDRQWNQLSQRNLLKRFRLIGTCFGHLTLTNARGRGFLLTGPAENTYSVIRLVEAKGLTGGKNLQFARDVTPKGIGYTLSQAEWSDGSRVILDSRGLLHFQSADRSIPEFSVVLSETQLSGWSADGRRWGASYFHGVGATLTPDAEIWKDLFSAFFHRLP